MTEHVDVLIVGAGLSGIGSACRLHTRLPQKSFAILEARDSIGGTWDTFRYPGVRSDSDMYTLGYDFEPWGSTMAIAEGHQIRDYIRATAAKYEIDTKVRFGYRALAASWSSADARWTVTYEHDGATTEITCSLLWANAGYFDHSVGFTPDFEGMADFKGTIVHPQHWPEDFDYAGKRVVVIGSGATAVTLIPAMADQVEHITMLQRSPTYMIALPRKSMVAGPLHLLLPKKQADFLTRWFHWGIFQLSYVLGKRWPRASSKALRWMASLQLPKDFDVDTHLNPTYDPWDQRLCLVPDGDLFKAIKRGQASIVTDRIERFTETGIRLQSGAELDADVIVTATGFTVTNFGELVFTVDGVEVDISQTVVYKGLMCSGVPNFVFSGGYTNASFTLKVNLTGDYVMRLLAHMDEIGAQIAMPQAPPDGRTAPLLLLSAGYIDRAAAILPKAGAYEPWALHQNYPRDIKLLRSGPIADEGLEFSTAAGPAV